MKGLMIAAVEIRTTALTRASAPGFILPYKFTIIDFCYKKGVYAFANLYRRECILDFIGTLISIEMEEKNNTVDRKSVV